MDKNSAFLSFIKQSNISYKENCVMANYTTLHLGGKADFLVEVASVDQIVLIVTKCNELNIPYVILGKGSNVLFTDLGYRGVVICLQKEFNKINVSENYIIAYGGAMLKDIAEVALDYHLKGFEFASGIPGTIGGACIMNAGAYGKEMKDVIYSVKYLDDDLKIKIANRNELSFEYRNSMFQNTKKIVLEVTLELEPGDFDDIKTAMNKYHDLRYNSQPMNSYSAGSTFKRPNGSYASLLIKEANLMGQRVNGCSVSCKHAGFLINDLDGTSEDFLNLVSLVQREVKKQSGFDLELEVKVIKEKEA